MNKIVYLIEQPLDERNYERFGIQTWIDRGWVIEVWDLTPLLHPLVWQKYFNLGGAVKGFNGYFAIESKKQLKCRYTESGKISYFIDLAGHDFYSISVKIHLVLLGAKRIILSIGSMPAARNQNSKFSAALRMGPAKSVTWLAKAFFRRVLMLLIRPEMGVASGSETLQSLGRVNEIIHAHNLDYDIYLKIKNASDDSKAGYALFIDQNYCFHSDFIYEGMSFPTTPEKYIPAISKALHKISNDLEVTMCVAAHPRSSYTQRDQKYFEAISIKYGATAKLIRDCSVVLCHDSTAIQFAILFKKPVIFVTTDELNASVWGASIEAFACELGKSVINIDSDLDAVDWEKKLLVDMEKYALYQSKYIKVNGSPEKSFWDIVIDHIDNQPHL